MAKEHLTQGSYNGFLRGFAPLRQLSNNRRVPMDYRAPEQFSTVTATCKANVYFDGRVVSHTITFADGSRKTLGLIYSGSYRFNTGVAERMEIIAGTCRVRIAGEEDWREFQAGTWFDVPADSFFEIEVSGGIAEYVCSFL
jgi:uncharacterized protein YaiE (UPF0345 family)